MKTQLFLDTRKNELFNYENAIGQEINYVRNDYSFTDWLSETYNSIELFELLKNQNDIEQAINKLKEDYEIQLRLLAEDTLNRVVDYEDYDDWKFYGVEI